VLSLPVSLLKAQRNIAREECRSGWGWGKTRGFRRAQFTEGHELDRKWRVPKAMIGRRLSQEEVKGLLAKLE